MNKIILVPLLLLTTALSFGQVTAEYSRLIGIADSLYNVKDYKNSALTFSNAFKANGWKAYPEHRYNAACSWALSGNIDSAFFQLRYMADKSKFSDYELVSTDPDLITLHSDKRWTQLLAQVQLNKDKKEEGLNKPLLHLLDSLETVDQKWRNLMTQLWNGELRGDTISAKTIAYNCSLTDSLNFYFVRDIFYKYGFPNYDLVGEKGSMNFWLLVQHQDRHPSFQDSVLTKMIVEVDSGKASASNYAYLVDRVKVNTGKPQIYGTQMQLNSDSTSYEPKNVIEPAKLNERRGSVGLDSIESYILMMNEVNVGTLKKKK